MVKIREKTGFGVWLRRPHQILCTRRQSLAGNLYEYIVVGLIFFILTLILTNFTLLHGSHQLFIEGPGDGTAGFLWFNSVDTDMNPLFAHTNMANYPTGENLQNPTQITYSAILLPLWVMSRLFGPIMGLNIITFFGFWSCAVAMYWLVRKLTHDPLVSFFAGYAAAYIPYHLINSSSHLTYIFSVVFVLMLAAFIGYWRRPTIRRAILFAGSLVLAFYTDGYFLLIGSIFASSLLLGGVAYDLLGRRFRKLLISRLKHLGVMAVTVVILSAPIGIVQLTQSAQVSGFLSGARDSIAFDIEYYSSHLIDFITPAPLNPFIKNNPNFQQIVAYQNTRSNDSEDVTYIGWTLIALVLIGGVLLASYLLNRKKSHLNNYPFMENYKLLFTIGCFSVPILVLCMLSPSLTFRGVHVITLGKILLHFDISLWRVMARFYLPLHVVFVVGASMVLAALVNKYKPNQLRPKNVLHASLYVLVVIVATGLMAAEYATSNSRPSYDFHKLPKVYSWIKNQSNIHVIAELPLLDRPLNINYNFATAQIIDDKKLINTPLTNNVPGTRTALGDVDSIEAINYAIARGADTIITHNKPCESQSWGHVVYIDKNKPMTQESAYYGSPICVYAINKSYRVDPFFVELQHGTFADVPYIQPGNGDEYQMIYAADGWLNVVNALGHKVHGRAVLDANIQSTPDAPFLRGDWSIYQDNRQLAKGSFPGDIVVKDIDASQPIHLHVSDIRGGTPAIFQVSLSHVVVSQVQPTE